MSFALLCAGLFTAWLPPAADTIESNPSYQEIKAKTGRSAEDQVRLALWCEAHGMAKERLNHLTLAILANPTHAGARSLMGMVAYEGRFQRPDKIAENLQAEPLLAEYDARRLKAPYTADGQWTLGLWADEHGLADQARAHFTVVIRLDPKRAEARRRLGQREHQGRWMTDAQIATEKADSETQKQADRKWSSALEDVRRRLAYPSKRAEAEAELAKLEDSRAVPSIVRVFGRVSSEQSRAVQLLGQIDSPASSRGLAILAIAGRTASVRRAATETLRGRDPVEYADLIISLLEEPIRFEVKHVAGLDSPGELLIEGKKANLRRVYAPPSPFQAGDQLGVNLSGQQVVFREIGPTAQATTTTTVGAMLSGTVATGTGPILTNPTEIRDTLSLVSGELAFMSSSQRLRIRFSDTAEIPLGQMIAEVKKSSAATEKKLREDAKVLEEHNLGVQLRNDRATAVLNGATGQSLAADRRVWSRWYVDRVGYASPSQGWNDLPAVTEMVAINYAPPSLPDGATRQVVGYERVDCFAAGTPVRTISGPRPIESLQVGDRVLTLDPKTGTLGFHPVLAAHRTSALPTYKIKLAGESIVASHFHRFWVAGRGWVMARELKVGDPIRTLGSIADVESIEPDQTQPVYNLDVAEDADYFVGAAAALVHDNTQPDPRLVLFDAGSLTTVIKTIP